MPTKDWLDDLRRKRPAMVAQTFASFSEEKVESGLDLGQQSYSANLRTYWQYLAASQGDKMLFTDRSPTTSLIRLRNTLSLAAMLELYIYGGG